MSSTVAMPMDTSATSNASAESASFKSFSDNEVDAKPSTDDSSEGGDDTGMVATASVLKDEDKHANTNGHGEVKKAEAEVVTAIKEKIATATPPVKDEAKKVEVDKKEDKIKPSEKVEKVEKIEAPAQESDDEDLGEDEVEAKKGDEVDHPTDEVDGKSKNVESKASPSKKKAKGKRGRKSKAAKKPSTPRTTPAVPRPRAPKKPRVSSEVAIGELDTGVAEQVKSDGLRRERKQVERFVAPTLMRETKIPGVVEEGRGTKLGHMEYVAAMINTKKCADLSALHRICFSRKGAVHEIKKNLKNFSGFQFEAGSKEFISKKTSMSKWNVKLLGEACAVLGIKKPGTRDLMVDAILEFCLKPDESHVEKKTLSAGKRSSSGSASRKSKSKSPAKIGRKSKETPPKSKGKPGKLKAVKRNMSSEEEPESDHDSEPDDKASEEEEEVVAPPKKKQKVEKKPKKTLAPEKSPSRALPSRGASAGKKYIDADEGEEEDEDELGHKSDQDKKKSAKKRSHEQSKRKKPVESDAEEDEDSEAEKKKAKKSHSKPEKNVDKKPEKEKSSSSSKEKEKPRKSTSFKPPKKLTEEEEEKEAIEKPDKDEDHHSSEEDVPKKKSKPEPVETGRDSDEEVDEKKSGFPTDTEIRKVVSETVKSSDLKTVTMKMMLQTIYSKFPEVDLASKKDFIKAEVKALL